DNEKRLQLSDIEKFDDPNFGFVYRYLLKGIPRETTLYVRLATTKGDQKSEFSETFTVKPE
ncbi:MAG: hypothetical protein KDD60_12370, partial [Bdellovibrionales bacterium]|nr:hypothetical protein [Bdellovibrionales bacterium]